MKKYSRIIMVLALLLVTSIVACIICCNLNGKNYTEDYRTYKKVKNIEDTHLLLDYCHDNNIAYSINNSEFKMNDRDITFLLDKSECMVVANEHMNNLNLLDKELYDFISVSTEKNDDGEIVRTLSLKTLTHRYELCDGNYLVYTAWPAYLSFFCCIVFGVALFFAIKYRNEAIRARRAQHNPNMD